MEVHTVCQIVGFFFSIIKWFFTSGITYLSSIRDMRFIPHIQMIFSIFSDKFRFLYANETHPQYVTKFDSPETDLLSFQ